METADPECDIAVLLPHAETGAILVREDPADGALRLPTKRTLLPPEAGMENAILAAEAAVGGRIVPLRLVMREMDEERRPTLTVVEAAPRAAEPAPGLRWAGVDELRDAIVPEAVRGAIDWWLERGRDGADVRGTVLRSTWTRPGWFERASAWMRERLAAAGLPATGEVRVMYLWPLAIVLRAPTASGPCFLKCAARTFPHEAAITAALAGRTPWGVPDVVAVEPAENWLLMRDLGEDALGAKPADAWADGAARLAELQRAWVGSTDALLAAGAVSRTPAALAEDVPGLLDQRGLGGRLGAGVRADWAAAVPRLVEACHRLAELPIPDTLVHGDFHPWNVVRTPDGLVVFDWSDGAVGHPFVDLATTVIRTPDLAIRRAIAERYLEAWPELPAAERGPAADLATVVGSLYQVQSYLGIYATLDLFELLDLVGADEQWVGRSLDALERGIAFRRGRE